MLGLRVDWEKRDSIHKIVVVVIDIIVYSNNSIIRRQKLKH